MKEKPHKNSARVIIIIHHVWFPFIHFCQQHLWFAFGLNSIPTTFPTESNAFPHIWWCKTNNQNAGIALVLLPSHIAVSMENSSNFQPFVYFIKHAKNPKWNRTKSNNMQIEMIPKIRDGGRLSFCFVCHFGFMCAVLANNFWRNAYTTRPNACNTNINLFIYITCVYFSI